MMKYAVLKHAIQEAPLKKKVSALVSLALVFVVLGVSVGHLALSSQAWGDYDGHWAASYMEKAKGRMWIKGYPDGTFRPDADITRAEFSVMLWRGLNLGTPSVECPFTDVAADAWYRREVTALWHAGIVEGYGKGIYAPEDLLTREMAATMLAKAFGLSAQDKKAYQSFADSGEVSDWAAPAVSALVEKQYMVGRGNKQLAPASSLTRGEMTKLLVTMFDGEGWKLPGESGNGGGNSSGNNSGTGQPSQDDGLVGEIGKTAHPRILMDEKRMTFLATACKTTEPYQTWYQTLKGKADGWLNVPPYPYDDSDALRLLSAENVCNRLMTLSFVYCVEGDERYAQRAFQEIEAIAAWPDWNPKHFLDTAALLKGTGIAYDWMYGYFNLPANGAKKATLLGAIENLGLKEAKLAYEGTANSWWVAADSNWNLVCNGGTAIAALSVADEPGLSDLCSFVLESGLSSKEKSLARFAPDGAWFEGTSYWDYAMKYLADYSGAFVTATGKDHVNLRRFGIEGTGYFPIAMTGLAQTFNLNDASEGKVDGSTLFFLANYFQEPMLAEYRRHQLEKQSMTPTVYDLLWYEAGSTSGSLNLKTDFLFRDSEVATFRNSYFEADSVYAGLHGGENGVNHGQIDAGQFIYEANGERWAIDLGGDNYNLHEYFYDANIEKSRWAYYRNRGEGHNTVVLNPGTLADQPLDGLAEIKTFQADGQKGIGVVDMQPIYGAYTDRAQRGLLLNKQDSSLMVQDELQFTGTGNELYWFMHTRASVALSPDQKSAVLTSASGERLWVGVLDNDNRFEVMAAKPLGTSPNPDLWPENLAKPSDGINTPIQNPNQGVTKLAIHNPNAGGNYTICVYMIPLAPGKTIPDSLPGVVAIAQW